jgi:hypothetical protein
MRFDAMPITEIEGTWEEIIAHAPEFVGRRLKVIILPFDAETRGGQLTPYNHIWSANELMRMSPEQRSLLLSEQSTYAESVYGEEPSLTDFDAFGDRDLFDETP